LGEDEGSSHRHHEVFVSALHYYRALSLPHALLDGIGDLAAPYSVCVVNQMINPIFFSHYAQILDSIRDSWGKAAGGGSNSQDVFRPYLFYLILE
jgi:hypothetical protein